MALGDEGSARELWDIIFGLLTGIGIYFIVSAYTDDLQIAGMSSVLGLGAYAFALLIGVLFS